MKKLREMWKKVKFRRFFSQVTLIVMIVLFPPATAAWISQDAVPGDTFYPLKRSLEAVFLRFYSYSPTSKTAYQISLGDKRFREATILLQTRGMTDGLPALVADVQAATKDLHNVKDSDEKEQLRKELTTKIDTYIVGLDKIQKQQPRVVRPTRAFVQPTPTFSPIIPPTMTMPTSYSPNIPTAVVPRVSPTLVLLPTSTPPDYSDTSFELRLEACELLSTPVDVTNCKLEVLKDQAEVAGRGGGLVHPTPTVVFTPTPTPCPNALDCSKIPAFADMARKQCEIDNATLLENNCVIPTRSPGHSGGPQGGEEPTSSPEPSPVIEISPTTVLPSDTPQPTVSPQPTAVPPTLLPSSTPSVQGVHTSYPKFCLFFFLCF